jgi:hypothetical protein
MWPYHGKIIACPIHNKLELRLNLNSASWFTTPMLSVIDLSTKPLCVTVISSHVSATSSHITIPWLEARSHDLWHRECYMIEWLSISFGETDLKFYRISICMGPREFFLGPVWLGIWQLCKAKKICCQMALSASASLAVSLLLWGEGRENKIKYSFIWLRCPHHCHGQTN